MGSHVVVCPKPIRDFVAQRERDFPGLRESFARALAEIEKADFGWSRTSQRAEIKFVPVGEIGVYSVIVVLKLVATGHASVVGVGFPQIGKPQ